MHGVLSPFRPLRLMLAVAVLALLAGCAVNPATGKREFSLVTQSQERAIGAEGHQAIMAEYGVYAEDPALTARVDSIGRALAAVSELPDLDFTASYNAIAIGNETSRTPRAPSVARR